MPSWVTALKEWNAGKGKWCIPRRGTPEHAQVVALMKKGTAKDDRPFAKAPGVASAIGKLMEVQRETKERNTARQVAALARAKAEAEAAAAAAAEAEAAAAAAAAAARPAWLVAAEEADARLRREVRAEIAARRAAEAAAREREKRATERATEGVAGLPADIQKVILKMVRPDDSFNLAKTFTSGKANFRARANAIFLGLAAFVEDGPEGKVRVTAPSGYLGQARDVANELPVLKELFGHTFRAGTRKFVSDFVITEPSSEQIEMLNNGMNYTEFSFSRRRPGMTAPMSVVIEWRVKDSDLNLRTKAGREELEYRKNIDSIAADSYLKRAARPDFLEYLDTLESRRVAKVMDTREMAKAAFKIPATEAKAEFVSPADFEAVYLSFFGDADRAKAAAAALRAKYPGRRAKFYGRKKLNILLEPSR